MSYDLYWIAAHPSEDPAEVFEALDLRADLSEVASAYEKGSRYVEKLSRERSPTPETE